MYYSPVTYAPQPVNNLYVGTSFGAMPRSMLAAKFEETVEPDQDEVYNDYARQTLTDRRCDKVLFESDEPHKNIAGSAATIQLHYYGHRGNTDDPAHPEIFTGFGGPEDHDPRGINTDPDMRKMEDQSRSRMRFKYMQSDMCDHTTSGRRSEARDISDHQRINAITKDRFKGFSRSLDGRRTSLNRVFKHASLANLDDVATKYGEYIKDKALNPQHRAVMISQHIIRDSEAYRAATLSTNNNGTVTNADGCRVRGAGAMYVRDSGVWHSKADIAHNVNNKTDAESAPARAAIILIQDILARKRALEIEQDYTPNDVGATTKAVVEATRKTNQRELANAETLLRAITADANLSASVMAMIYKTATPQIADHGARVHEHDGTVGNTGASFENALAVYKTMIGGDIGQTRRSCVTDSHVITAGADSVELSYDRKTGRARVSESKAQVLAGAIEVHGEQRQTHQYKTLHRVAGGVDRDIGGAGSRDGDMSTKKTEEALHDRKSAATALATKYLGGRKVQEEEVRGGGNAEPLRHGGRLGKRRLRKYMDRDDD